MRAGVEFLGSECGEQIDWQVRVTRIVHRKLRYRRRCPCPGPRTVIAPPAPNPVPKGRAPRDSWPGCLYRLGSAGAADGPARPIGLLLWTRLRALMAKGGFNRYWRFHPRKEHERIYHARYRESCILFE